MEGISQVSRLYPHPFTLPLKSPPRRSESTPTPCLQNTQHKTKPVNSLCTTNVTCVVPNKQFCPHKCVRQYTLGHNFHYIHHKV